MFNRWSAFVHDLVWVPLAVWLSFWIRFDLGTIPTAHLSAFWTVLAIAVPTQALTFWRFGLYRGIWRFASVPDLIRILKAVSVGAGLTYLLHFLFARLEGMPRSVMLLYPLVLIMGLTGPRLLYRWQKDHRLRLARRNAQRALILGAGRPGELLVRDLLRDRRYEPIAFLDDAAKNLGRELHGVRVVGRIDELGAKLEPLAIDIVLVALPAAGRDLMRRIVEVCGAKGVRSVTLPSLEELPESQVSIEQLREIRIEDLLGREAVSLDNAGLNALLNGKRVLVTGAGGSIGSELCRQVASYAPARLVMVDNGEFNLYSIEQEMTKRAPRDVLAAVLGDVRDETRMRWVYETYRPQIVLHAAAYKHVPLVEDNPGEGVKTNVFGTRTVADLAQEHGVETFLLVSTDKAVNPTNIMGASKRVAEIFCQAMNVRGGTAFITTRFGNVLDSAGSVVPLFRKQIEQGGPVTVTHPDITRFFMTIPEAVSLILQATTMGNGGEIYVLEMGEPVKILDMAREMIRLSGRVAEKEIPIEFIGLRPGEKLHEELFHGAEKPLDTRHPKILLAQARRTDLEHVREKLEQLGNAVAARDVAAMRRGLHGLVPEYERSV